MKKFSRETLKRISVRQISVQVSSERQSQAPIGVGLCFTPVVSMHDAAIGILGVHSTYTTLN